MYTEINQKSKWAPSESSSAFGIFGVHDKQNHYGNINIQEMFALRQNALYGQISEIDVWIEMRIHQYPLRSASRQFIQEVKSAADCLNLAEILAAIDRYMIAISQKQDGQKPMEVFKTPVAAATETGYST